MFLPLTRYHYWSDNIKGNHPQMAELFRLVKYYNLPRWIIGLSTGYLRLATIEGVMTWQRKPTTCS